MEIPVLSQAALIVVDVQNGFMPGGGLPVANGDSIVPVINRIAPRFTHVVLTQDWHPANHISFAANHPGRQPYERIELPYGPQILWPIHCVQGTHDADFHPDLRIPHAQIILRKGANPLVDSYSTFMEADRLTSTGLAACLRMRGIRAVYLCGLATDYCVAWSALDACSAGFETWVIEDACGAIDLDGSLAKAWDGMMAAGVKRIQSTSLFS